MLDRFKRGDDDRKGSGAVATKDRAQARNGETRTSDRSTRTTDASAPAERTSGRAAAGGPLTRDALRTARARQRDEFGGLNWGSSFFGWLVAVGVAAILTAFLAAAGAAVGLTSASDVQSIGVGGAIALIAALMLAYFCGGYVAGRMSRFDGGRQGIGVWVIALVVTVALALLALIAGDDYNVLERLGLPSLPVGESELRSGGWIVLLAIVAGTLVAAMSGGKMGERYHRRVDRAAFVD
jgi:amino acid transporter